MDAPLVTVSAAREADASALVALVNRLAAERNFLFIMPVDPATGAAVLRDHIAAIARTGNEAVFVARHADGLIGMASALRGGHPSRRHAVEIGLGVHPGWRGRRIGRSLLAAIEEWAAGAGVRRLALSVVTSNHRAVALYRSAGFALEGCWRQSAQCEGEFHDEYLMAKLLGGAAAAAE